MAIRERECVSKVRFRGEILRSARRIFGTTIVGTYLIISRPMNILGINAFHGDASAVLVKDGELVAAIEEERLNRRKHCAGFPALAAKAVLDARSASRPPSVDHVADLA